MPKRRIHYGSSSVGKLASKENDISTETDEEKKKQILHAAEMGDLKTLRAELESEDEEGIGLLLKLSDYKDRTILEIATENEHWEIVNYLITDHSQLHKLLWNTVYESLMLAISKGYLRITQSILEHPMFKRGKDRNRLGSISHYFEQPRKNSKFDQHVTPLMLAAHCNDIDIIRLFLDRGEKIKTPHLSTCNCVACTNKRMFDSLKHSKSRINTYMALSSPAYISLTSPDPILTAFDLSRELGILASREKEFKAIFRVLSNQCKKYTSDLLDMCQSSQEVNNLLSGENKVESLQRNGLSRVKLGILYEQKQFVAHAHCQHQLSNLFYGDLTIWKDSNFIKRILLCIILLASLPVWIIAYWIFPHSKMGRILKTPLVKFVLHTISYICFIFLLFFDSTLIEDKYDPVKDIPIHQRLCDSLCNTSCIIYQCVKDAGMCESIQNLGSPCLNRRIAYASPLEYIILIYVLGYFWNEIKQILNEGSKRYFSSIWNWLDICMLNFYICYFVLITVAYVKIVKTDAFFNEMCPTEIVEKTAEHVYYLTADRRLWRSTDPVLIADAMFAVANVLSFTRVSFILPASEFLGPLQISLGRMLGDVVRFLVVFMVVFLAFFCATYNLYGYYAANVEDVNDTESGAVKAFASFEITMLSLIWAIFGLGDSGDYTIPVEYDHTVTQVCGTLLLLMYHLAMVLVMLNMLIAMMAASFEDIQADEDVEWKFARAQLWISYFEAGTLPVPFNLVPSPKTCWMAYKWVRDHWMPRKSGHKLERWERKRELENEPQGPQVGMGGGDTMLGTLGLFNVSTRSNVVMSVLESENLLKGIVKRYLFRLQREKDSDEVGEAELGEIKYDISSLRYEIMQKLDSASIMQREEMESRDDEVTVHQRENRDVKERMALVENNLFLLVGEIQKLRRDLVLNGFAERSDDNVLIARV